MWWILIRIGGITLSLHPLFVIIMLLSVLTGQFLELLTLFAIVLIHEFGHVGAARMYGLDVVSVQLLPFGGVAVVEDHGRMTAGKEIIIALAGPLQNAVMISAAWLLLSAGWGNPEFLQYLIHANTVIALFNLLPVLPLDGGRIVRAAVSEVTPYYFTLLWSGRISIAASAGIVAYSLLPLLSGNGPLLNLLLIGGFLLATNVQDQRNLPYRFLAFLTHRNTESDRRLAEGGTARPIVAPSAKPLESVLRLFRRNHYHLIYVVNDQGTIVAVVPEQRLVSSFLRIS